jgi:hypothetical protein
MQTDVLRIKWKHFRNEITYNWTELTSDDLDRINGRPDLIVLLECRYGYARGRAEREVERVVTEFEDKLRRAS